MPIALVLGGAKWVEDDARRALALFEPDAVAAVNDMISRWPGPIDYAFTLHPEKLSNWIRHRAARGGNLNFECWSHRKRGPYLRSHVREVHKVAEDWGGSSGLLAVSGLKAEGFTGVVLAGVPLSPEAGHVVRGVEWRPARSYRRGWLTALPRYKDIARSMSGWTKELLGEPTPEWLGAVAAGGARSR